MPTMTRVPLLSAGVAFATLLAAPTAALACGGFFCSSVNLVPVQQNAERILFEVHDDGTVTAVVEISYAGDPDDFSWVVPVTDTPDLEVEVDAWALTMLDDATAPSIVPPPTKCTSTPSPFPQNRAMAGGDDDDSSFDEDGVVVEDLEQVGPFDPTVVSSDDPDALIAWLNDNDYLITPEMEPFVAEYVAAGMKFLALKLAPDAESDDVAPISMTYPATEPMIPIQLTAVAAEPEMGVIALIAAEDRYESSNWETFEIATEDVMANPRTGQSNYYPLVSWRLDQAGGQGTIAQFSGDLGGVADTAINNWSWDPTFDPALEYISDLSDQHGTITRLYTRASAWEMASDPFFTATDAGDLSNTIDLSDRDAVEVCRGNAADQRVACGNTYCGQDALCAETEQGIDGCICPDGFAARLITAPRALARDLQPTVTCESLDFELMASVAEMSDVAFGDDPCASDSCGENGACVAVNGFGTCSCDDGYAAIDLDGRDVTCVKAGRTYDADQLLWAGCACSTGDADQPAALALLLLLGAAGALRRRTARPERAEPRQHVPQGRAGATP